MISWGKKHFLAILLVTLIEWISDPFRSSVTSNQGDEKVTVNHLVDGFVANR